MDLQRVSAITPEKHSAFYRYFHPYFTRLPGNVSKKYIEAYTSPGDVVLDPFCGSGVVGIESLLLGRSTICSDLSPLAVFITGELLNKDVSLDVLSRRYDQLSEKVGPIIQKIWSYGSDELYLGNNKYFTELEQQYWYPRGKLTHRSNITSIEELFDKRQLLTYAVLFSHINQIREKGIRNTLLIVLFGVMSRANLTYMVSGSREGSILHNGGSSLFSIYDYRRPKKVVVIPPWERFERKYKDIFKVKKLTKQAFSMQPNEIFDASAVLKADVLKLGNHIDENSIDYIFTDPPYGAKIPYLELASMWAAWMNWPITNADLRAEIIEGGELSKSKDEYCDLMLESVKVMASLLKKGGSASMVFQHPSLEVWASLVEAAHDSNLNFDYATIQPTSSASIIKKKFNSNIVSMPLILNFTKKSKAKKINYTGGLNLDWREVEKRLKVEHRLGGGAGLTVEKVYNIVTHEYLSNGIRLDPQQVMLKIDKYIKEFSINSLTFIEK